VRAVVLTDAGLTFDAAYPEPKPKRGEVIVRVLRAGICGTDLEMLRGYKGFRGVPGHEFVGVVEGCDDCPSLVGKRVVGEINVGCGECARCQSVGPGHCSTREVMGLIARDGAFAEKVSLPIGNLFVVDDAVAEERTVFAEPLAAALHILWQVSVAKRDRVVVLGPGRLGRLVAMVLRRHTPDLTLVGRSDAVPDDPDLVIDCTGTPEGFARAVECAGPLGTVVLKSTCAGDATVPASLLTKIVVNENDVIGSRCGSRENFEDAATMLVSGDIDPSPLVEATYRLEDFARAFAHAARPGALKVLFDPTL
jgi:threonine dehydrogenase-like Zn-dependent dehydrogenase